MYKIVSATSHSRPIPQGKIHFSYLFTLAACYNSAFQMDFTWQAFLYRTRIDPSAPIIVRCEDNLVCLLAMKTDAILSKMAL